MINRDQLFKEVYNNTVNLAYEIQEIQQSVNEEILTFSTQAEKIKSKPLSKVYAEICSILREIALCRLEIKELYYKWTDVINNKVDNIINEEVKELKNTKERLQTLEDIKNNMEDNVFKQYISLLYQEIEYFNGVRMNADTENYICMIIRNYVILTLMYISECEFYIALTSNDYSQKKEIIEASKKLFNSIVDLVDTFTKIKWTVDFAKNLEYFSSSLDKEYVANKFIEDSDNNLCKIEKQQELLSNTYYVYQLLLNILKESLDED